ncbi:GAF domain-containing sensor histidine kinase [Roseisolibacter sp. H3M3-2]|uniref:GAF domain-containing sensor histidine kinase n=1 Tax=Roseisolibacter sp. H3M3-2 TaxID=3031323 RepID=UPI0023DAC8C0|nr:GAF domain-containing sensor histidine kinase [Roseisolibacter sp. H3M3-2]MDF1501355.1 GAF domain-containing sensor histidine kinase [Roseisolibacter sp. H3M3-2]
MSPPPVQPAAEPVVPESPADAPRVTLLEDPARLDALRRTALLDSPAEEAFDRFTRLAARLLRAPVALVSLVDADRQFFKSQVGLPDPVAESRETPLSHSFCRHAVERGAPLVVADAHAHPLVRDNGAVTDLGIVSYLGIPLATSDGVVLGTICVLDHTPRSWAPEELQTLGDLAAAVATEIELRAALREAERARAAANEASRAKDDFLALVSHELRSPLAGIASNAQMLAMGLCGPVTERQLQALGRIKRSDDHLLYLIDQLLDLKRIAAGRMQYDLHAVALQSVLRDALELTEPQMLAGGIEIERPAIAPELRVRTDPGRLRQILVNVLANAGKFTDRGGTVSVTCTDAEGVVRLEVHDTGIGIPEDQREAIFEPFVQVRDTGEHRPRGSGLGLAISRALARGMGGDLTVRSTLGEGSTFAISLPRAD